jgi:hypothetical protein
MTDRILKLLGATDELDALRVIEEANKFLSDVKETTGRESFAGSLEVMRGAISLSREIATITEKPAEETLGVVMAWKSSHERLPAVETDKLALEEKVRVQDVAALIKAGLETPRAGANEHAGKLTPATAKFWETKSASELQAFLAIAPRVMPGEVKQAPPAGPTVFSQNPQGRVSTADGKVFEELLPMALQTLKKSDRPLYDAMRSDWERVGKPAGVVAN